MRRGFFQTAGFAAFVLFCLSCGSVSETKPPPYAIEKPQYSGDKSEISAVVFDHLGYDVKKFSEDVPNDWLKENFRAQWIRTYQVKNRTSLADQAATFPRYTVVEEVYETPELAAKRLMRIQEKSPNLPAEQDYYWMVTGFQRQKNIYFIQTDASVFYERIEDFAGKIEEELSRNARNR